MGRCGEEGFESSENENGDGNENEDENGDENGHVT
jgi:hypothetical protein